jgi:maltose-binding protein MalE
MKMDEIINKQGLTAAEVAHELRAPTTVSRKKPEEAAEIVQGVRTAQYGEPNPNHPLMKLARSDVPRFRKRRAT